VLDRLNLLEDAIASYSAALSLDPTINLCNSNLALSLVALNRHEEALPYFQRAREVEPDAPQPVFNESLARLAMGDFAHGWTDYEARLRVPELKINPYDFSQPRWDGRESLAGKTILLHGEQGLGDTILFARFVEPVVQTGARVILAMQKPLVRLMRSIPGVAQVITHGDPLPDFDFHAPVGSLPLVFQTTLETLPARTSYLQAPTESDTIAGLNLSADPRPTVGVCWAGNPNYPNDQNRSIPLPIFRRLFQVPGIHFISLQQNLRPGDGEILARLDNIDLTSDRKGSDLADTAALMSRLDLVITVDTVIAHLAGALRRPVWIPLTVRSYWAWLRHRTDSPLYPSARLFRQAEIGDWKPVMDSIAAALGYFAAQYAR
jgi:tetratricopeptide (TPR) repeat protein